MEAQTQYLSIPIGEKSLRVNVRFLICMNICLIAIFDSYTFWSLLVPGKIIIYVLKLLCLPALFYLAAKNKLKNYLLAFCILPFVWVYLETQLFNSIQYAFSGITAMLCFALLTATEKVQVAKWYLRIISYFLLVGLILYFLVIILGINIYKTDIEHPDGRMYANYFHVYYYAHYVRYRFASIFDEPGVLGTLAAIATFYYKKLLKPWQYIVYIFSGILSISLFYITLFLPLLLLATIQFASFGKQVKKIIIFITVMIMLYLSLCFTINALKSNDIIRVFIYERFEWKSGFITGIVNVRDDDIKGLNETFDNLGKRPDYKLVLGHGRQAVTEDFGGAGLSYKVFIYRFGFLIAAYLLTIFFAMHPWRKRFLFSLISFLFVLAIFIQRPLIYKIDFFILLYTGIRIIPDLFDEKNRKNITDHT